MGALHFRTGFRKRLHTMVGAAGHLPWVSLALAAAAVLIWLCPALGPALQYERSALAAGELWRLVSCHLTHWSADHLLWDALALVVLGGLCEREDRRVFLGTLAASALLIPVAVQTGLPDLTTYRGLSGLDSALFLLLAVRVLRESLTEHRWGWVAAAGIVAAGFVGKVAFEWLTGTTLFVDSTAAGMQPVPLAHVVGGLVGATGGLLPARR